MSLNIKKDFGETRRRPDLTTLVYGKVPPQAPDFEEAVLGACLLERETYNDICGIIYSPDCFYVDAHQKIWQAMGGCVATGNPVDLLTVTEFLSKANDLELIGGAYYLTKLTMSVNSSAHAESHARFIVEKFIQRELIRVCGTVIGAAYEDSTDVFELYEQLESDLLAIMKNIGGAGDASIGSLFLKVLGELDVQRKNKSALTGIDTGIYELNDITCGWQKSDLIIIGGRPGKGKTALGLNLALSAAVSNLSKGVPVGIFSLEMGATQLVKRIVSTVTKIPFDKVYSGNLTDGEFLSVSQYTKYFNSLPIRISDKTRMWVKIKSQAKKWKEKHNIGLLVIDYLQLMKTTRNKNDNREQEISGITGDCKELAKELDIPIILLSQLNRNVESKSVQEPTPADLRESGAIEQDADMIIFPWHLSFNESRISIAKHRNGKTAVGDDALKVKFSGAFQKWVGENDTDFSVADNPRSGIVPNYGRVDKQDEDAPF